MQSETMPRWAEGQFKLREAMHWWIEAAAERWKHTPWGAGHDEGIFTRTWPAYYLLTGDQTAYDFLDRLVSEFIDCPVVEACNCFLTDEDAAEYPPGQRRRPPFHGYPADQACFVHAPENYAWFLTHVAHINPSPKVRQALEDCAEHVGNWSPEAQPWYDWQEHRFRSSIFGTLRVRDYPPYDFETLALVRVMILASNAYYITQDRKYLDVCTDWADKWARIVLESDPEQGFPVALFPCPESEIEERYGDIGRRLRSKTKFNYELGNLLLDLYYYTHKESYAQAVHKMLNIDQDWSAPAQGLPRISSILAAKYRSITGDKSFDSRIVCAADSMLVDESDNRPAIVIMNKSTEQFLNTPGLVYVQVFKDRRIILDNRNTAILTAAFMVTQDTRYLEYAMNLAANRFYDSHYIWDGRELGCRGSWQGRNGVAMHNVMVPMMCSAMGGFGMLEGERPWFEVRYTQANGKPGLPDNVAALFVPGSPKQRTIRFYNRSENAEQVYAIPDNTRVGSFDRPLVAVTAVLDGEPLPKPDSPITIPPLKSVTLTIELQ
ncbi:MAG: hypothetical protein QHI38_00715 [Armatimonadota bacterium]|nr:hypothetical protein [Armatimonadota bacterium]